MSLSFLPELDIENNLPVVFSRESYIAFSGRYVTMADLLSYANLYITNTFTAGQIFIQGITTTSINGISSNTLNYLKNVTSDIQSQFAQVYLYLTNWQYDVNSNTQIIKNNTAFTDMLICNTSNTNTLFNNSILTNSIYTNTISTQTLTVTNPEYPIAYIFYGTATYPLIKSNAFSNLTGLTYTPTVSMYLSLAPKFSITILSSTGVLLAIVSNTTDDWIHYTPLPFGSYIPYSYILMRIN